MATFDEATMARLREMLESRRAELMDQVGGLEDEVRELTTDEDDEGKGLSNHQADTGSDVNEQERLSTIGEDLRDSLAQVNAALARMDDGTYGTCRRCGKPIDPERLEAFPFVQYDIECQQLIEQGLAAPPADA